MDSTTPTTASARASRRPRRCFPHARARSTSRAAHGNLQRVHARDRRGARDALRRARRRRTARTSRARSASCLASPTPRSRGRARARARYRDEAAAAARGLRPAPDADAGLRRADLRGRGRRLAPRWAITRFTNPFNALGWPALALPCGPAEHGLPASIQLVGRPGEDAFVLAAGLALEAQVRGLELPKQGGEPCASPVPPQSSSLALLLASGRGRRDACPSSTASLAAPQSLHGFLLRADEPPQDTFTRTPSFAWQPVAGANRYEFQLATVADVRVRRAARAQDDAHTRRLARDLAAVDHRHAVLALRARPRGRAGRSDDAVERALRLQHALDEPADAARGAAGPDPLDAGRRRHRVPGLVPRRRTRSSRRRRTSPTSASTTPSTRTRVDEHVHWRIRAVRAVRRRRASHARTACPRRSFGPWSPVVHVDEPAVRRRAARAELETISDAVSTATAPACTSHAGVLVHAATQISSGTSTELYRVYVATDRTA